MGAYFPCTEVEGFDSHIVHAWVVSSAVRVLGLHPSCRGFESLTTHNIAGVTQWLESLPSKQVVVGSNPITRFKCSLL